MLECLLLAKADVGELPLLAAAAVPHFISGFGGCRC
jgi:hypothetical protein